MNKSHVAVALTLLLGLGLAGETFAGGFVITPLGGVVRGPRGVVAWSPLGIAGRRNPVCMPAGGGYQSMSYAQQVPLSYSYAYGQQVPLVLTNANAAGASATAEAQGLTESIELIRTILGLVREGGGGGILGGGNQSNLESRVKTLETEVAAIKMLLSLSSSGNGGRTKTGSTPGQWDPATASAVLKAFAESQQAQASAQDAAGQEVGQQQLLMATPALTPDQVNLLARQLLMQMKVRKIMVEDGDQQIKDEAERLEDILDKLKAEAAKLK